MVVAKKGSKKETKTKKIKKVSEGRGVISGSFSRRNTIISLTKENGEVLKQVSAGSLGYRGARKKSAWVAQKVADEIIRQATEYGIYNIKLQVKKIGAGRNAVIKKVLESPSLNLEELIDKTPEKHGGCRPRKSPRK
jgi:small subunit ribosomal protein S11